MTIVMTIEDIIKITGYLPHNETLSSRDEGRHWVHVRTHSWL